MKKWKNKEEGLNSLRSIALLQKAKENRGLTKSVLKLLDFEREPLNIPVRMRELIVDFVPEQIVYLVYRDGNHYLAAEKPLKTKRICNSTHNGVTAWWVRPEDFDMT